MNGNEKGPAEYMRYSLIQACAIDDVRVNDSMLKVLIALGSYASKENSHWCWTKQEKIAARLGVTRQYVGQNCLDLAACGYIVIRDGYREDGGRTSSSYKLLIDYELPEEYLRRNRTRRRAGIGGRPKGDPLKLNAVSYPLKLNAVSPPETPAVSPPETPAVSPPETPAVSSLNPEPESGILNRKLKSFHTSRQKEKAGDAPRAAPKPLTATQWAHSAEGEAYLRKQGVTDTDIKRVSSTVFALFDMWRKIAGRV